MRDFGPDLFAGTADYYAKYRAKYPPELFRDVVEYFDLNGQGSLLDLGCGTGELAIPLAKYFQKVLAMDPEPEMLAVGKRKARSAGARNIDWRIGSSKDLTGVKGVFWLITLGQSFHWMDTQTVINQLYGLLKPGAGLLIVGSGNLMGNQNHSSPKKYITDKDMAIKGLVTKYLGPERRAGNAIYTPTSKSWEDDLFPNSKFGRFDKRTYTIKAVRDIEQELGNLYSMSWARREFFGQKINDFEDELRAELSRLSSTGKFVNRVSFETYFLTKTA